MNIINYTLENELIGSKKLGTDWHRRLKILHSNSKKDQFMQTTKTLLNSDHFTSKLPHILKEKEFDLKESNINKIFTSQWLDERKCIMGTKCNKLVLLDTVTGKYSVQNPLKSHPNSRNIQNHCGIHSISINPSRTLLATGADHVNDLAIYSLPSLDPVLVGFNAHKYWIFDIVWLDNEHVVTGAGDNRLALWSINNSDKKPIFQRSNRINTSLSLTTSPQQSSSPSIDSNSNKILNYLDIDGRLDRRNLKRPSPSSPPLASRIPIRLNSFWNSQSPISSNFFNFYNTNRASQISTQSTSSSSFFSPLSNLPAPPVPNNRFSFYNIENYMTQSNRRNSINSLLNINDDVDMVNNNENITEDEDDEDEQEEERVQIDNQENDYTFGDEELNYFTDDFEEEEEDDDEDDDDNESENDIYNIETNYDNDFELDIEHDIENSFQKRRRLNFFGKFQKSTNLNNQKLKYKTPTKVIKCKQSKRIRALAFNPKRNEIAAISMNAAFHYFDINRFEQKYTKKLSPLKENVCLTINSDYSIYAIGSASHVQLLDANNARAITYPIFIKKDIGVRSLHFRNNIVSIGTGVGTILFYDVRANKFLFKEQEGGNMENHLSLQTNGGWILRNETYYENLSYAYNTDNSHAIYSHSYDPTGTKLLTVGGPLTINLYGHYAGVWQ